MLPGPSAGDATPGKANKIPEVSEALPYRSPSWQIVLAGNGKIGGYASMRCQDCGT
jgi:hypothetical protein